MSTNFTRAAGFVLVFVGILIIATMAEAQNTKMTFSGWSVATEIDLNDDGYRATSNTVTGKGTFGHFTSHNVSETAPVFPTGSCGTGLLEASYIYVTAVTRSSNGDLIFSRLDPDNPSTACFNPANYTTNITSNLVILGGTGRFEGATGWATNTVVVFGLNGITRMTHGAFVGSSEGEIFLLGGSFRSKD